MRLHSVINQEVSIADELSAAGKCGEAFEHLERAHVLGQASTREHTRVHWLMLKIAVKKRNLREIWGQIIRVVGAITKTPFGIYPTGNTGGSDVWFFERMPIPEDLQAILRSAKL